MAEENQHIETFKVTAQGRGWPTKVNVSETNWEIQLDEPVEDGGSNSGAVDDSNGSYKEVRLHARVQGDVTQEQVQELGNRVDKRCPILALLRSSGCAIHSSWTLS